MACFADSGHMISELDLCRHKSDNIHEHSRPKTDHMGDKLLRLRYSALKYGAVWHAHTHNDIIYAHKAAFSHHELKRVTS